MTLFLNAHADRLAPGSFQQPVPVPAALPTEPPFVTVCFNKDWLPYILGCLFQLALNTTWQGDDTQVMNGLQQANDLILLFTQALAGCQTKNPAFSGTNGDEFMLRQNPDNPCELQTSVDGTTWCTWADISKCTMTPQPGKGSPQPPSGSCTNYFATVGVTDRWLLPNNINSGDVITIRNAQGTWTSNALDADLPLCPDGNVFFAVGCVSGTGFLDSGDPDPTKNHLALLAFDGTNYYDCGPASDGTPVVITIPPGITQGRLLLLANTHYLGGFGSVTCDVNYCNNAVPNWTHTIDFTLNTGGFAPRTYAGGSWGAWVGGTGWVASDAVDTSADWWRRIDIELSGISPFALDTASILFDWTGGSVASSPLNGDILEAIVGGTPTQEWLDLWSAMTSGTGQHRFGSTPVASVDALRLYLMISEQNSSGALTGTAVIKSLTLSGHGPNPFGP